MEGLLYLESTFTWNIFDGVRIWCEEISISRTSLSLAILFLSLGVFLNMSYIGLSSSLSPSITPIRRLWPFCISSGEGSRELTDIQGDNSSWRLAKFVWIPIEAVTVRPILVCVLFETIVSNCFDFSWDFFFSSRCFWYKSVRAETVLR